MRKNLKPVGIKTSWQTWLLLFFFGLLCSSWSNVHADMYIEAKTTEYAMGQQTGQERLEKTYLTADKMKTMDAEGEIVILRLDKGLMWNIDRNEKKYTEITFEEMRQMAQQAMKIMEDTLAELSPEEKEQMEQYMPQLSTLKRPEIKIEKTGKTKDISGYKCELIIVSSDTTKSEMWVTDQLQYDKDAKKFLESISATFSDIASLREQATMYQSLIKIEGFPMETKITTTVGPRSFSSVSTVTTVENKKIKDSEFDLPLGLTKIRAPGTP